MTTTYTLYMSLVKPKLLRKTRMQPVYCLLTAGFHEAANAGISFIQGPKMSIFARQGRLIASIHVQFGMDVRNFTSFGGCTGVGTRPQNSNISTFGIKIRPAGESPRFADFYQC